MAESIIQGKSFQFALTVIALYKKLQAQREFVLSKQLLRYYEVGRVLGQMLRKPRLPKVVGTFYRKWRSLPRKRGKLNIG